MLTLAWVKLHRAGSKYKLATDDVNGNNELPEALRALPKPSLVRIDLLD